MGNQLKRTDIAFALVLKQRSFNTLIDFVHDKFCKEFLYMYLSEIYRNDHAHDHLKKPSATCMLIAVL
jgi:hypothetical protein